MMTFQDRTTCDWYLEGVSPNSRLIMDASELPDKVVDVKFWRDYGAEGPVREFYAIGEVVIGNDFE